MNVIIPMAGRGKRLLPHTLTTPKPLLHIAGKPMVYHIVEELARTLPEPINEICFVTGLFGKEVEEELMRIAESVNAKGKIAYQKKPLGTADALLAAADTLSGKAMVVFADTLFKGRFSIPAELDGIIWVSKVENPSAFGVVKINEEGIIQEFIEKPQKFVSDLAITGIYYFKEGEILLKELKYLVDHQILSNGEYQLTDALERLKETGFRFGVELIDEWLDCGNKNAVLKTNKRILRIENNMATATDTTGVKIIPPCFIGKNVKLTDSEIGPYVSIGNNSIINHSVIKNSIIHSYCFLDHVIFENSMIGNYVRYQAQSKHRFAMEVSLGDYSNITMNA